MKQKKVIILGGRGFVGKKCSKYLESQGYNIEVIDRNEMDLAVRGSRSTLKQKIGRNDIIQNLAAIKRQVKDSKNIKKENNNIVQNIVEGVKDTIERGYHDLLLIQVSSCAVYGEENEHYKYDEKSELNPTSHYGEHKVEAEEMIRKELPRQNVLILRPPLIYGEKEDTYGPTKFRKNAMSGEIIRLWGSGGEKRSFLYINDMTYIIRKLIEKEARGTFNTCNPNSVSYIELIRILEKKYKELNYCEKERTKPLVNHTYNIQKLIDCVGDISFKGINEYLLE